jgi:hypothetical protein
MIGGNIKSLIPGPSRLSMPTVTVGASSTVPMPGAALLGTVSLACESLPLRERLEDAGGPPRRVMRRRSTVPAGGRCTKR